MRYILINLKASCKGRLAISLSERQRKSNYSANLTQRVVESYLDWNFAVVEIDNHDVAKPLCLCCIAIVTGCGILGKHMQSGAFDF